MRRIALVTTRSKQFVITAVLAAAWRAPAQEIKSTYPTMTPADQYMMERTAEIALAKTQMFAAIKAGFEKNAFPALGSGAVWPDGTAL